jgi:hypothetical protein
VSLVELSTWQAKRQSLPQQLNPAEAGRHHRVFPPVRAPLTPLTADPLVSGTEKILRE